MNEEEVQLPPLHNSSDLIAEELNDYWLDPTKDYPDPRYLFEYNGVGFSPLGGIQAISGQKKNGKTFVLAQLMAAALGSGSERCEEYLPGLNVRDTTIEYLREKNNDKNYLPRVLYCDTEMEKLNTAKVLRRVHWLCGWDMRSSSDRFRVLWLREVQKGIKESVNHERWRLIKLAIDQMKPDIVFIDGLRDLVNDFNDNTESSRIVSEMMSLASQKNICIWNVLHMNPRPSNDDESKMRGHLGTELGNKVSDTFVSIKKKSEATGHVTFIVRQQDARGKDVDDWHFEITDDVGGLGIPKIIDSSAPGTITTRQTVEPDTPEQILAWINQANDLCDWPLTRSKIKEFIFGEIGGQRNNDKRQADLIIAINKGYLIETAIKSKGSYLLQPPEDLPF